MSRKFDGDLKTVSAKFSELSSAKQLSNFTRVIVPTDPQAF